MEYGGLFDIEFNVNFILICVLIFFFLILLKFKLEKFKYR